jgi:type I restriction enzyme S subunit
MPRTSDSWRLVPLSQITEEQVEKVGDRRHLTVLSSTKHYGLVPSGDYFKNRTIYSSDTSNYKVVREGWFAYATNHLTEGSIGLQDSFGVACVSPIYTVFSCMDEVYPPYLFRVLKSPQMISKYEIHEQASVDRRGAVRYRDFGRIEIMLPPKREQRRIADILDAVDERIRTLAVYRDKLAIVGREILRKKFEAFHFRAKSRLDEIALVDRGRFSARPRNDPSFYGGQYPFIQTGDVARSDGGVIMNAMQTLNSLGRCMSKEFPEGTIAVTIAANIGDTGMLGRPMCFPDSVVGVVVKTSEMLPRFVEICIRSAKPLLEARAPQSAQKNINLQDLRPLKIPFPSLSEQHEIVGLWDDQNRLLSLTKNLEGKFRRLRLGLTEDLLAGRVRVSEAEAVLENL